MKELIKNIVQAARRGHYQTRNRIGDLQCSELPGSEPSCARSEAESDLTTIRQAIAAWDAVEPNSEVDQDRITFCLYTGPGGGFDRMTLAELLRDQAESARYVARAENSGSEACYVEVAAWNYKRHKWMRYAHSKIFTGDIGGLEDLQACKLVADMINDAARNSNISLIHSLPNYQD